MDGLNYRLVYLQELAWFVSLCVVYLYYYANQEAGSELLYLEILPGKPNHIRGLFNGHTHLLCVLEFSLPKNIH